MDRLKIFIYLANQTKTKYRKQYFRLLKSRNIANIMQKVIGRHIHYKRKNYCEHK